MHVWHRLLLCLYGKNSKMLGSVFGQEYEETQYSLGLDLADWST